MAEKSLPWGGTSTGDAGPYTSTQWSDMWATLFTVDQTTQGIVPWYGGKLAASKSSSNVVLVQSGAALVHGTFYKSDSSVTISVPSSVSSTRNDIIVLEKVFTSQQVRLNRVAGTEGAGVPSVTQDGVRWQIKIADVTVTSAGVQSVTNSNVFIHLGVPVNGVIYSTSTTVPAGFAELTTARGRFVVGLPSGGTIAGTSGTVGTVGTALTDLGTVTHTHEYTEVPRHRHGATGRGPQSNDISEQNQMSSVIWGSNDWGQTTLTAAQHTTMAYEGSATCTTASTDATMPYLQLMVLVKS